MPFGTQQPGNRAARQAMPAALLRSGALPMSNARKRQRRSETAHAWVTVGPSAGLCRKTVAALAESISGQWSTGRRTAIFRPRTTAVAREKPSYDADTSGPSVRRLRPNPWQETRRVGRQTPAARPAPMHKQRRTQCKAGRSNDCIVNRERSPPTAAGHSDFAGGTCPATSWFAVQSLARSAQYAFRCRKPRSMVMRMIFRSSHSDQWFT